MPLETEGISIGNTNMISKMPLHLMLVRVTNNAIMYAKTTVTSVAITVETIELDNAGKNVGEEKTFLIFSMLIFENIFISGTKTNTLNVNANTILETSAL